jgi:hypothetical protein
MQVSGGIGVVISINKRQGICRNTNFMMKVFKRAGLEPPRTNINYSCVLNSKRVGARPIPTIYEILMR